MPLLIPWAQLQDLDHDCQPLRHNIGCCFQLCVFTLYLGMKSVLIQHHTSPHPPENMETLGGKRGCDFCNHYRVYGNTSWVRGIHVRIDSRDVA
jgi:hypothetical protein